DGIDVTTRRSEAMAHTNFAAVYATLPGTMTVYENLSVFSLMYDVKNRRQRIGEVIHEFDLEAFRNQKCGSLSSGEQTRVNLAKAMLNKPPPLLLDEPPASLDPSTAHDIRSKIRSFAAESAGGVRCTVHNSLEVEEVC